MIMKTTMKKYLIPLTLWMMLFVSMTACKSQTTTPEELLKIMDLDEKSYSQFTPCEQINTFAEVGYQFMDVEHMYVNLPSWVYDTIREHGMEINAACINRQISRYLAAIDENPTVYKDTSLKIHSLIYLSISLDLLTNLDIINALRTVVCEKKILDYENFTVTYFLTKANQLPSYFLGKPEDLDRLWVEACKS